jgi:hypothetical protein
MCAFASAEVLDHVNHQDIPASWTVFHAQPGYVWQNVLFNLVVVVIVVEGASVIVFLGIAIASALMSTPPLPYVVACLLIPAGIAGTLVTYLVRISILQIRTVGKIKDQVVVVTPEGFVAYAGDKPQDTVAVDFADLDTISQTVLPTRSENMFYLRLVYKKTAQPKSLDWRIPPQFPSLDVIAQTIIEAHLRYTLEHANQG